MKKNVLQAMIFALVFGLFGCTNEIPEEPLRSISWSLQQIGAELDTDGIPATSTTGIKITFSDTVSSFSTDEVTIGGVATKSGAPTGTGMDWIVPITVIEEGNATVSINKSGVEKEEKNVTVYKITQEQDITYTAVADGEAAAVTSTKITFTFEEEIIGLEAADITITNDTGKAVKGTLTGSAKIWDLSISEVVAGDITVKIDKAGIEADEKIVTLHELITWTALADGEAGTTTSTKIIFIFSSALENLLESDIIITKGTGEAAMGALTGSAKIWDLSISEVAAGDITVKIDKAGIEAAEKIVTLHEKLITWTALADGEAGTTSSTEINFSFSETVENLLENEIEITNDTGKATKGTVSGSGTAWSLALSNVAEGSVKVKINKSGIETTEILVVVYEAGFVPNITWTALADGEGSTTTSTKIDFIFSAALDILLENEIQITNRTGSVSKGTVSGSGTTWSIALSDVAVAGGVKVWINKLDIETTERTIMVHIAKTYNLGDIGPGGGRIFYRSTGGFTFYTSSTDTVGIRAHYLEAAPDNLPRLAWASPDFYRANITGTASTIGTGLKNTLIILNTDADAPAAKACYEYTYEGINDWFLPSVNELQQLKTNQNVVGTPVNGGRVWSSSQLSDPTYPDGVWVEIFPNGYPNIFGFKNNTENVRPIRAF